MGRTVSVFRVRSNEEFQKGADPLGLTLGTANSLKMYQEVYTRFDYFVRYYGSGWRVRLSN